MSLPALTSNGSTPGDFSEIEAALAGKAGALPILGELVRAEPVGVDTPPRRRRA